MNSLRKIVVAIGLVLGTFWSISNATENGNAAIDSVVIDVRTDAEWKGGHLEGAILIPHDRIEEGIKTAVPDKNTKIYLYCRSGRRTGIAFDVLKKAGYADLINLGTVENASKTLHRTVIK
jgi:phage shock protein E